MYIKQKLFTILVTMTMTMKCELIILSYSTVMQGLYKSIQSKMCTQENNMKECNFTFAFMFVAVVRSSSPTDVLHFVSWK